MTKYLEPSKGATLAAVDPIVFWSHVQKSDNCWTWMFTTNTKGYGMFKVQGLYRRAHRIAYELLVGTIPAGLFACHHCDNPTCVRPDHLFLGTNRDNLRDASRKGRTKGPHWWKSGMCRPGLHDITIPGSTRPVRAKTKGSPYNECVACALARQQKHRMARRTA